MPRQGGSKDGDRFLSAWFLSSNRAINRDSPMAGILIPPTGKGKRGRELDVSPRGKNKAIHVD